MNIFKTIMNWIMCQINGHDWYQVDSDTTRCIYCGKYKTSNYR